MSRFYEDDAHLDEQDCPCCGRSLFPNGQCLNGCHRHNYKRRDDNN
jgi:hypothetical protein